MTADRSSEQFRIFAIMGILLMLTFAMFNLSGTIDQLQHVHGGASHAHILLSEVTAEHIDDAMPALHGQADGSADHVPGHHHQGDNGYSMLAQVPSALALIQLTDTQVRTTPAAYRVGSSATSLERPPKKLTA